MPPDAQTIVNKRGYLQTGQITCHDTTGHTIPYPGSGQDGELRKGVPWPVPRFEPEGDTVLDPLTGLVWQRTAGVKERIF